MSGLVTATVSSPLGPLELFATGAALTGMYFAGRAPSHADAVQAVEHPVLSQAARELSEYFAGERHRFAVPLATDGTAFQRQVWALLETIPFGVTWSYADLAAAVGNPRAVRAVGAANGKNPLSIIVPCHRVINTGGDLGGYGGGLDNKRWLLAHEGAAPVLPGLSR